MPAYDKLAFFVAICQYSSNGIISAKYNTSIKTKIFLYMALKIQPLSDRVLVEPQAAETKTASGIFIPDTAKEKPQKGKVVAVGKGKEDYKMTVKVGDSVLYGKYAGTELKLDGKDYLIMREEDIFAIV
jgi:chaperonin GroES